MVGMEMEMQKNKGGTFPRVGSLNWLLHLGRNSLDLKRK